MNQEPNLKVVICAITLAFSANAASANYAKWCVEAYEKSDVERAEPMARSLMRNAHGFNRADATMGIQCLLQYTGETYTYDPTTRRFHTQKSLDEEQRQIRERTELNREEERQQAAATRAARIEEQARSRRVAELAQRIEEERQAREREVLDRLNEACTSMYARDADATITNRLCFDVFWETGLPK